MHCSCKLFLLFVRFFLAYFMQNYAVFGEKTSMNIYKVVLMKLNINRQNNVCLTI